MLTSRRRLAATFIAGAMLVSFAAPVAADTIVTSVPLSELELVKAGVDLVTLTNRERAAVGRIALRLDPDLMAVARDRANVMAANDILSHTEPGGGKVYDRLNAAGIHWYAAAEIIAWNPYPTEAQTVASAVRMWMASPGHHSVIVSTGYNYVGFGAAVSATGRRYFAGVYVKQRDETGARAKFGTISKRSASGDRTRVTIRWSGSDVRLQTMTAGLRYFQVQRRRVGQAAWYSWPVTTATSRTVTWSRAYDREVRVRARDKNGNWGSWQVIRINL